MKKSFDVWKIAFAGFFIALAIVLPFLTGQIPQIGNALSPMHIPALLAGFVCGPVIGAIVGFVSPLFRFMLFGMPPLFPTGFAMACELTAYACICGIIYNHGKKTIADVYISLVVAMLGGRIVWGIVQFILSSFVGFEFGLGIFFASAFVNAVPGIICHIVIVPLVVIALKKAKLME